MRSRALESAAPARSRASAAAAAVRSRSSEPKVGLSGGAPLYCPPGAKEEPHSSAVPCGGPSETRASRRSKALSWRAWVHGVAGWMGARAGRLDGCVSPGHSLRSTATGHSQGWGRGGAGRGAGRARLGGQLDVRLDEDLEELRGAQLLEERAHRLGRPLEEARLVEGLRADAQGYGLSPTGRQPLIYTGLQPLIQGVAASEPVLEREAHRVQLAS